MLQHRDHDISALCVFKDYAYDFHRDLRSGVAGIDRAGLCIKDNFPYIFSPPLLKIRQFPRQRIGVLRCIRHAVDRMKSHFGFLQPEGPSCVVKKQPLSSITVLIDVVELLPDLFELSRCKHSLRINSHVCLSLSEMNLINTIS